MEELGVVPLNIKVGAEKELDEPGAFAIDAKGGFMGSLLDGDVGLNELKVCGAKKPLPTAGCEPAAAVGASMMELGLLETGKNNAVETAGGAEVRTAVVALGEKMGVADLAEKANAGTPVLAGGADVGFGICGMVREGAKARVGVVVLGEKVGVAEVAEKANAGTPVLARWAEKGMGAVEVAERGGVVVEAENAILEKGVGFDEDIVEASVGRGEGLKMAGV